MDSSVNWLVILLLIALALFAIGLIGRGIELVWQAVPASREQANVRWHRPGWIVAEAEITDKGHLAPGSNPPYFVTYRFTDSAGATEQSHTRTQPVYAAQHAALLKGSITEVRYPPTQPNDAELVMHQITSTPDSEGWQPTFESVVNGVLLPFVLILNLVKLAQIRYGTPDLDLAGLPMEVTTPGEKGWSYIIGGIGILLLGFIMLAATPSQVVTTTP